MTRLFRVYKPPLHPGAGSGSRQNQIAAHGVLELFMLSPDLHIAMLFLRAILGVHGRDELAPALKALSALLEHQRLDLYPLPSDPQRRFEEAMAWGAEFGNNLGDLAMDEVCRELRELESAPGGLEVVIEAALELDYILKSCFTNPPDLSPLLRAARVLPKLPAVLELRSVVEWLKAEELTDRVPALRRQAERLRIQDFAMMLADVVPGAGNPLVPEEDST
jgi:predicted component of type VI protein secretion system